jgi:hypothetical protein
MSDTFNHNKLLEFLAKKATKAGEAGDWRDHTPAAKDLATLQAKREQKKFTFQKPMADRTAEQQASPYATERYVGKKEVEGITAEEIAAIRARGPARDAEGRLTGETTKAEDPKVPTRSRDTYMRPAQLKPFAANTTPDPNKHFPSQYDKEETETGDWRKDKVPAGATGMKTPYYRGPEQEAHRVTVDKGGKLKNARGEDLDTSKAEGGRVSGSTEGREIFAMDTQGGIFTTDPVQKMDENTKIVDDPHHSSLLHGGKSGGAGEFGTRPAEKGTLNVVSDLSGHYAPKPGHTADVINELEAQSASMIGKDGKRAMVELSYDESGLFSGRKKEVEDKSSGKKRAPAEIPLEDRRFVLARRVEGEGDDDVVTEYWSNDAGWTDRESSSNFTEAEIKKVDMPLGGFWVELDPMMSKQEGSGAVTMDFERFSQTGGNLPKIAAKRNVVEDIKKRGADQPGEVLAKLKEEKEQRKAKTAKLAEEAEADPDKRLEMWMEKGKQFKQPWPADLQALAERLGAKWDGDSWDLDGDMVNGSALMAIMAEKNLSDENRKEDMQLLK